MKAISLIVTGLAAFILTYVLVPLNIKLSYKYGLHDHPHDRGIHKEKVPNTGGLSFALTVIILQIIFIFVFPDYSERLIPFVIIGFLITVLGFFDDIKGCNYKLKLFFQVLVILTAYYLGFQIEILTNPFGQDIYLGFMSLPVTVVWFLLVINAMNLIDGLDGLASGISIIVALVLLVIGLNSNNFIVALLSVMLMFSNIAFLRYNFYPAKIFMGDTGSMFLGLNIASISVIGTFQIKGITTITLIIPLLALGIPISDFIMAISRRIKNKKNIFHADKEHIHHQLLESGLNQREIAIISYMITLLFGLIAIGFSFVSKDIVLLILIFLYFILAFFLFLLLKFHKKRDK